MHTTAFAPLIRTGQSVEVRARARRKGCRPRRPYPPTLEDLVWKGLSPSPVVMRLCFRRRRAVGRGPVPPKSAGGHYRSRHKVFYSLLFYSCASFGHAISYFILREFYIRTVVTIFIGENRTPVSPQTAAFEHNLLTHSYHPCYRQMVDHAGGDKQASGGLRGPPNA
jgi:hypothetical protein